MQTNWQDTSYALSNTKMATSDLMDEGNRSDFHIKDQSLLDL